MAPSSQMRLLEFCVHFDTTGAARPIGWWELWRGLVIVLAICYQKALDVKYPCIMLPFEGLGS